MCVCVYVCVCLVCLCGKARSDVWNLWSALTEPVNEDIGGRTLFSFLDPSMEEVW